MTDLTESRRDLVVRAHSAADAAVLTASALHVSIEQASDPRLFTITEVNYGSSFLLAGPRGVIAVF